VILKEAQGDKPAVLWKYGAFIQTTVDFLLLAFCIFVMIKAMNSWKRNAQEEPPAPEAPPADVALLTEIRDLLARDKQSSGS
jgi:large conductance mechanosensitive channel